MLSKIGIVLNLPKVLVAGLVLGVIPWIVSIYIFPRPGRCPPNFRNAIAWDKLDGDSKHAPSLLPLGDSAHRLRPLNEQSMVLTSGVRTDGHYPNGVHGNLIPEQSIPDFGPTLNGPVLQNNSPKTDAISAQPMSEPVLATGPEMRYPTTDSLMGPILPGGMTMTEMPANREDAVPSPAASTNHGLVLPEAVYSTPAVQTTTMPSSPERTPARAELPPPSQEPEWLPASPRVTVPVRSEQLESIARQADQEIRHGFELASRGAYYAARSKFIAALRLVAQGLDTDRQTTIHGKSLAAGLTAMKEAEDFLPRGSMVEANLDIPSLVASHVTPALKTTETAQMTAFSALKSYMTYAQGQFAAAVEGEMAGSMALRGLGKLHEELAKKQNSEIQAAGTKAIVFYQAALLVAPQNYMAANDLGVMLARAGNLNDARAILENSAALSRQSTVLNNLATVYQRMGRNDLSFQVKQQSLLAQREEQARRQSMGVMASNNSVQWVAPETFAQTSPNLGVPPSTTGKPTAPQQPNNANRQFPNNYQR
jgi:tetratricopeptide (TPR) repeat protein